MLALTGGEDFSHDDGWFIAPPIFSFSSRRKRENGPCTVQKRKRSNVPAGGRETRGTGKPLVRLARGYFSISTFLSPLPSSGGCFSFHPSSRAMI